MSCRWRQGSFVSPNLTAAGRSSRWTDRELFRAIRNGIDPGGRPLHWQLPWRSVDKMDAIELAALYECLNMT